MRIYAYFRLSIGDTNLSYHIDYLRGIGYSVQKNRVILEEVEAGISLKHRNKFINLVNYSMESGDLLIINGIDSLGGNFREVYSSISMIFRKNIRLICLDFSENEIIGDVKKVFVHFLKLCSDFEDKSSFSNKSVINKTKKPVGRPEILCEKKKKEVLDEFKKGNSIYSIAKNFSVTRTVIKRIILKYSDDIR